MLYECVAKHSNPPDVTVKKEKFGSNRPPQFQNITLYLEMHRQRFDDSARFCNIPYAWLKILSMLLSMSFLMITASLAAQAAVLSVLCYNYLAHIEVQ